MQTHRYKELVEEYILSKQDAWSPTTLRSERYRLLGLEPRFLYDPKAMYESLKAKGMKPYAIKTTFTRFGELYQFILDEQKSTKIKGVNAIKKYIKANARLFKNAYVPKELPFTPDEILAKIDLIGDLASRALAYQTFLGGLRFAENKTLTKEGMVIGKGNKARFIPMLEDEETVQYDKVYGTFLYHLGKVGLTPHMLRKASATLAAEEVQKIGGGVADLMQMYGWNSADTAMKYIQASKTKALGEKLRQHLKKQGVSKDGTRK